ncbi:MAG: hypothetical protein J5679_01100 [Alphaproteobacteria bacterium]|nr:hypothetical protein [Alphaproteobacteria bacterium]
MIKHICKFLSKIIIATTIACCATTSFAATNIPSGPVGEIGDYGTFATEHNKNELVKKLVGENGTGGDLRVFQQEFQEQIVHDYVPVEARVGIAMVNGLNEIAKILDSTLVRFMIVFIIIMYLFWIMLEAYNMMTTDSNVQKLVETIVKKTIILIAWIAVLHIGPAKLFMYAVSPIISLGTYIADFILNAITSAAGIVVPDTCGAIHNYAAATVPADMIIDANATASVLCVPTRLSGFFVTAIAAGWHWMIDGVGHSVFTFTMGAVFVVLFAWNTWKFALMALSVVMSLFLAILLLPFTAFAETIPQTSYKGIVGNVFNSFVGLFNAGPVKLDEQINKFINAAIYFVALSIVIAICAALLSGVINTDLVTHIPTLKDDGFIPLLLSGALVAWLADKADKTARDIMGSNADKMGKEIGGSDTGKKFADDIKAVIKNTYDTAKSWAKAYNDSKK